MSSTSVCWSIALLLLFYSKKLLYWCTVRFHSSACCRASFSFLLQVVYERVLEQRILLQRCLQASNGLPRPHSHALLRSQHPEAAER